MLTPEIHRVSPDFYCALGAVQSVHFFDSWGSMERREVQADLRHIIPNIIHDVPAVFPGGVCVQGEQLDVHYHKNDLH
jgi:hypothetical protein